MKAAEAVRRLRTIRREARSILAGRPAPALARSMQAVERACRLAAWQIGDTSSLLTEDDEEERPPRPARRGAAKRVPLRRRPRRKAAG